MDVSKVVNFLKVITGYDESEHELIESACAAATAEITAHLRSGISESDHETRLIYAAAALANYKYRLMTSARDDYSVFKAGDIAISKNSSDSISKAKELYLDSVSKLSDLLLDNDNFVFRTT